MKNTQGATLNLKLAGIVGAMVMLHKEGTAPVPLAEIGHEHLHHLVPGDTITITVSGNPQWEQAQARAAEKTAAVRAPDDVNHDAANTGKPDALPPADPLAGQGAVTSDNSVTRTRSTGKGAT